MGSYELTSTQNKITLQATQDSSASLISGPSLAVVSRSSILQHTLPVSLVPFEASFNQDMKVLTPSKDVDIHYSLHALRANAGPILRTTSKQGGSVNSLDATRFFKYQLPLPPLPLQVEIAKTMDQFTQLEGSLKDELEARIEQLQHFRSTILNNPSFPQRDVGELVQPQPAPSGLKRSNYLPNGRYPVIDQGHTRIAGYCNDNSLALNIGPCVIFGDHTRTIKYVDFTFVPGAEGVRPLLPLKDIDPRYLFHALSNLNIPSRGYSRHWTILSKMKIPVPPPELQLDIVCTLDNFDSLINDPIFGLPAEIEARRKQYEYYRDRLLTFPEKK